MAVSRLIVGAHRADNGGRGLARKHPANVLKVNGGRSRRDKMMHRGDDIITAALTRRVQSRTFRAADPRAEIAHETWLSIFQEENDRVPSRDRRHMPRYAARLIKSECVLKILYDRSALKMTLCVPMSAYSSRGDESEVRRGESRKGSVSLSLSLSFPPRSSRLSPFLVACLLAPASTGGS